MRRRLTCMIGPASRLGRGSWAPAAAGRQVIAQYLLDKYSDRGPSFTLATPELRAKAASITRTLDIYIHSIQGCMYRAMPAQQRADSLKALDFQLDALERLADPGGPWLAGDLTSADAAVRGLRMAGVPRVPWNVLLPLFRGCGGSGALPLPGVSGRSPAHRAWTVCGAGVPHHVLHDLHAAQVLRLGVHLGQAAAPAGVVGPRHRGPSVREGAKMYAFFVCRVT